MAARAQGRNVDCNSTTASSVPPTARTALAAHPTRATPPTLARLAAADGTMPPLQEAYREHHRLQCVNRTPGMLRPSFGMVLEKRARPL